ncbi:MAG: endonuclease III domain-containing protein [Anaerolineae bacterium]
MDQDRIPQHEKATIVQARLLETFGEPTWRRHLDPVPELVSTILSQNTNDTNRDKAFERLRDRFSSWEGVRDAEVDDIIDAIRPAGLANQKGPRIQNALRFVTEQRGELDLEFLADWPLEEAKDWLSSIKGVGPKTAAIVLLFSLGKPAFPVDTHVHRVTKRLGLIGPKVSREKAHDELEQLVPPEDYYSFHLNVIRHGREICTSRKPRCEECVLSDLCDYYQDVRS